MYEGNKRGHYTGPLGTLQGIKSLVETLEPLWLSLKVVRKSKTNHKNASDVKSVFLKSMNTHIRKNIPSSKFDWIWCLYVYKQVHVQLNAFPWSHCEWYRYFMFLLKTHYGIHWYLKISVEKREKQDRPVVTMIWSDWTMLQFERINTNFIEVVEIAQRLTNTVLSTNTIQSTVHIINLMYGPQGNR